VGAEVIPARESSLGAGAIYGCASTDVLTFARGSTGLGASGSTAETWKRRTVAASKLVTPPLCHGCYRPTMKRRTQNFIVLMAGTALTVQGLCGGAGSEFSEYY